MMENNMFMYKYWDVLDIPFTWWFKMWHIYSASKSHNPYLEEGNDGSFCYNTDMGKVGTGQILAHSLLSIVITVSMRLDVLHARICAKGFD